MQILIFAICQPYQCSSGLLYGPAHIQMYFQGRVVVINIADCEMMKGNLPKRQKRLISAWIEIHREELFAAWKLRQSGKNHLRYNR